MTLRTKCHEMMGDAAVLMLIFLLNGCEPRVEAGRNDSIPKSEIEALKAERLDATLRTENAKHGR
jgi:hypothetical protein